MRSEPSPVPTPVLSPLSHLSICFCLCEYASVALSSIVIFLGQVIAYEEIKKIIILFHQGLHYKIVYGKGRN